MGISRELLRGSTELLVLSLLEEEDLYGYMMIKKLTQKSENIFKLQEGTLYPILHALEEKGYITSYWDETGSKKKKYYTITKKGKKQLVEKKQEWKTYTYGVCQVIGGVLFAN